MIRLIFKLTNELIKIEIEGREIYYTDRLNKRINLVPKFNKEEKKEYDKAKTERELMEICMKDIEGKWGGKLIDAKFE